MVLRALSLETFNFNNLNYWLMELSLPHFEAHSWAYGTNRYRCGRGKNVVLVRAILKGNVHLPNM